MVDTYRLSTMHIVIGQVSHHFAQVILCPCLINAFLDIRNVINLVHETQSESQFTHPLLQVYIQSKWGIFVQKE